MYKAKIVAVTEGDDLTISSVKVEFTSGENTITEVFTYADYQFRDKKDILNMLEEKCTILDNKETALEAVQSLVGTEDAISEIKKQIEEEKALIESTIETPVEATADTPVDVPVEAPIGA